MFLGETEEKLLQLVGKPVFRSYTNPEKLYYQNENFEGSFILYGGRIIKIEFSVRHRVSPSLYFLSALGIRQNDLLKKTAAEQVEYILKAYKNPRHTYISNKLTVYSRGIRFIFEGDKIKRIEIFYPRRHP
ncbi:MAG: hypothetical protein OEZ13_09155 [Spirochaetia bacterium]|nr:hypothetical protein [Spirochaetia bacterium]